MFSARGIVLSTFKKTMLKRDFDIGLQRVPATYWQEYYHHMQVDALNPRSFNGFNFLRNNCQNSLSVTPSTSSRIFSISNLWTENTKPSSVFLHSRVLHFSIFPLPTERKKCFRTENCVGLATTNYDFAFDHTSEFRF